MQIKVVGESFHEDNLRLICGPATEEARYVNRKAVLTLEDDNPHDENAVLVEIDGLRVGHLSREDAVRFRTKHSRRDDRQVQCDASITARSGEAASDYGVCLELDFLDDHGQPLNRQFNERRRADRAIHEMLGFVKGVLCDGSVSDKEATALSTWFAANSDVIKVWPGYVLAARLEKIFTDGRISEEERADLMALLASTVGGGPSDEENAATRLPIDDPAPMLTFPGQLYVFTGQFVYGTRSQCQQEIMTRGGQCHPRVTRKVNVLVVGCDGSEDWAHTSFGRKIDAAVKLKREGLPIAIVDEEHWVTQLHRIT